MGYDVSISFATPDKEIAEEIYRRLSLRGVKCYYYLHNPEDTLGEDLLLKLRQIYSESNITLIINSKNYLTPYTEVELEAAIHGVAKKTGVIPVKVDDHPLPSALEGRTYWELSNGTDTLVNAILKKLKRWNLQNPSALMLALTLTSALLLYIIWGLGFNDLNRKVDLFFTLLGLAPILWFLIFRIVPWGIKREKLKKLKGDILLQSTPLRKLEFWETYLRNLVVIVLIILAVFATSQRNRIIEDDNELINFSTSFYNLNVSQNGLLKNISSLVTKASTRILPNELEESIWDKKEYSLLVDSLKLAQREIGIGLESQQINLNDSLIHSYLEILSQNIRILDSYIEHQITELCRDHADLGYESWLARRRQLTQTLMSYNQLFTENIFELESSSAKINAYAEQLLIKHRNKWRGVL